MVRILSPDVTTSPDTNENRILYLTTSGIWYICRGEESYLKYRSLLVLGDDCPIAQFLFYLGLYVEVVNKPESGYGARVLLRTGRALTFTANRSQGEKYWVTEVELQQVSRNHFNLVRYVGHPTK